MHLIIDSVFDGAILRLAFDKIQKKKKKKQNEMCIFDIW